MKFIVLGNSEFTLRCVQGLLASREEVVALVSMPTALRPLNSIHLESFALEHQIPYHEADDINSQEALTFLRKCGADYILASWPRLLRKEVLTIPRRYVIGTHPTTLPHNRGRHPLHWLIALGISHTHLTFFRMDEEVDTGTVLLQIPFDIGTEESISAVVDKMNEAAFVGVQQLCGIFITDPTYVGTMQNDNMANYWRKRTSHDVILDFRMSSKFIINTVRSFAPPYPCAKLLFRNHVLPVIHVMLTSTNPEYAHIQRIEPGCVIWARERILRVKAEDALIDVECANDLPPELLQAKYIHPPSKYILDWYDILKDKFS